MDTTAQPKQITGTIKNIVFQNKENGYTVLRTTDGRTLVGIVPDVSANLREAEFTAAGVWKRHKAYGPQFDFTELTINESDLFYFLSRIVRGIGRKMARRLLTLYEEDRLINILDNRPQELTKVKGIKDKKLKSITESWNRFKDLKNLSNVLTPHGASQTLLIRVYKHFADDPGIPEKIRENPFLMTEVKGIGFKTADSIARRMGIDPHSLFRIKSCIDYVIMDETNNGGNSSITQDNLFARADGELRYEDTEGKASHIDREGFDNSLSALVAENRIVLLDESRLTSTFLYRAETTILEVVRSKCSVQELPIIPDADAFICAKEKEMGIQFSEKQKAAIQKINEGVLFLILCGYAGTGKSTIGRAMLDLLSQRHTKESMMCCALSGIASDRIRKATGYNAGTIQSLLVKANKENSKLPYQVLLVDEASMVNSELFYRLFTKLKNDCIIILVGDPAQLPPIGAGNPFHDLIESGIAPTVELTRIYRQSEDKVLSYFANFVRKGEVPPNYKNPYSDFRFIDISIENYFALRNKLSQREKKELRDQNSNEILEQILKIAERFKATAATLYRNKEMSDYIGYFQLITPIKNGILGVNNLNHKLQQLMNPQSQNPEKLDLGFVELHLNDRVVHITNQDMDSYEPEAFKSRNRNAYVQRQRIYNGMIGIFFRIDRSDELLWVYYPADRVVVEYTFDEARDLLRLSYALTIHKTQGSEFQNVVIPMTFSHFIMLNNKLLYTAITRAKESCYIVGERYAFASACTRKDVTVRDTVMQIKLNSSKNSIPNKT